MRILGIDPGQTTGTYLMADHQRTARQFGPAEHHTELYVYIAECHPDVVVCEQFLNRGKRPANLVAREYVGVAKVGAHTYDYVAQYPEQKEWWTDSKIEKVNLTIPGTLKEKIHSTDALRHVLYYLTFAIHDLTWVNLLGPNG